MLATVALVDLLDAGAAASAARGDLIELADDAPTLHLYVIDLATICRHGLWRDPGYAEWLDVIEGEGPSPALIISAATSALDRSVRIRSTDRPRICAGAAGARCGCGFDVPSGEVEDGVEGVGDVGHERVDVGDRGRVDVEPDVEVVAVAQDRRVERGPGRADRTGSSAITGAPAM